MNILINTPLLKSTALRTDFDNKIIIVFLGLIIGLVILGLVFINLMRTFSSPFPPNEEGPAELPKIRATMYT